MFRWSTNDLFALRGINQHFRSIGGELVNHVLQHLLTFVVGTIVVLTPLLILGQVVVQLLFLPIGQGVVNQTDHSFPHHMQTVVKKFLCKVLILASPPVDIDFAVACAEDATEGHCIMLDESKNAKRMVIPVTII